MIYVCLIVRKRVKNSHHNNQLKPSENDTNSKSPFVFNYHFFTCFTNY